MKIWNNFFLILMISCSPAFSQSGESPRISVYGDASSVTPADMITCWLNIYETTVNYDYTVVPDEKKLRRSQISVIEKLDCKNFMSNPNYANLSSYTGTGPYELKFHNKQEYELMLNKVGQLSVENLSVTMDISSCDITKEKRKQITDKLLDNALLDAKSKAEKIAIALTVTLGLPLYVEEISDLPYTGYGYETEYSYNLNPEITVTKRVQIQYEIIR